MSSPTWKLVVPLTLTFPVVVLLLLSLACGNNNEDRWKNEFPEVMERINAAMLTPAAAILEV